MKLHPVKGRKSFNNLKNSGSRSKTGNFSVVFIASEDLRVSFVVTKKIGMAVVRNRVKRRIKAAILTEMDSLAIGSYLIIPYNDLTLLNFMELKTELINTMRKSAKRYFDKKV